MTSSSNSNPRSDDLTATTDVVVVDYGSITEEAEQVIDLGDFRSPVAKVIDLGDFHTAATKVVDLGDFGGKSEPK